MINRLVSFSKQNPVYRGMLGLLTLLFPLVLTACGEANATPAPTPVNQVTVTIATTTAVPSPTATILPTATAVPALPTATLIPPTPTPVPLPNALLLGGQDNSWGEISRYQAGANDKLEEIKFNSENLDSFSQLFIYAPALAPISPGAIGNTYQLTFPTAVNKELQAGSLDWVRRLDGQILPILRDRATGQFRAIASLQALGAVPALLPAGPFIALTVVAIVGSLLVSDGIEQQLGVINKKLDEIKQFLEADKRTRLEAIWNLLNEFSGLLSQQKVTSDQIGRFQSEYQFGILGVDPQQISYLMRDQMESTYNSYKDANLDKKAFFFYDSDKVAELNRLLENYQHYSSSYITSLTVRHLAAQISASLPGKPDVPSGRLSDLKKELDTWKQNQTKFYNLVESKVQEFEGLLRDDKARTQFLDAAKTGKQNTEQEYNRLSQLFTSTLDKIKTKTQTTEQPLKLVVTLDDKGKVVKVSKLV